MARSTKHDDTRPPLTDARLRVGVNFSVVTVVVAVLALGVFSALAVAGHPQDSFSPLALALAWASFAGFALCAASGTIEVGWRRRATALARLLTAGGPRLARLADQQPAPFAAENEMTATSIFGPFANPSRWSGIWRALAGVVGAAIMLVVAVEISPLLIEYVRRQPVAAGETEIYSVTQYTLVVVLVALALFTAWWGLYSAWHTAGLIREVRYAGNERLLVGWSGRLRRAHTSLLRWATAQARFLGGAALGVLALAVVSGLAARQLALSLLVGAAVLVGGGILLWLLGVGQAEAGASPGPVDVAGSARARRSHAHLAAVAWADIDAFCILARRRGMLGRSHTIFGVHAASTFVTWEIGSGASATQQAAHERLCWLIVTRTGLPLRDLTALASDTAQQGG